MANILPIDKQKTAIHALCEGNSIRSIERMTGIHRDTIMRLGVRVGNGCKAMMDERMRNLQCREVQIDEIWGFVGKKNRKTTEKERREEGKGDVWTFVAIDADTKLVPSFLVGKRSHDNAKAFLNDISSRVANRVQISSDSLKAYQDIIRMGQSPAFDWGIVSKTYSVTNLGPQGRYSPADVIRVEKHVMLGSPEVENISTSYVESQNLTMRMHCRRLTRLTNAFSKKLENMQAAVALHFGYFNFVRRHSTLKTTPAMAAGLESREWTIEDLLATS